MSAYQNDRPRRKLPALLVVLVVLVAALVAAGIHFRPRFESQPPQIRLAPDSAVIGAAPLEITALDAGAGLEVAVHHAGRGRSGKRASPPSSSRRRSRRRR